MISGPMIYKFQNTEGEVFYIYELLTWRMIILHVYSWHNTALKFPSGNLGNVFQFASIYIPQRVL